jgi:cytochrome c-type biogenesis protein CcmH
MPEPLLLLAGLAVAALVVLAPLRARPSPAPATDDRDAAAVRHRVALEALRDIEADRRAGSLDAAAYDRQRAEAEQWAAASAAALQRPSNGGDAPTSRFDGRGRRAAIAAAAAIGIALLVGSTVPASGIPNQTISNHALADSQAAEAARQQRIGELLDAFAADPQDAATLSELADAYLAGTELEDLARAASALQLLIGLEPNRADAYERIIGAYLRAGDAANARAAHDAYAALPTADEVEVAFFDGLIALRGEADPDRARAAFDRFLELVPDDPRAPMIRALREDAAAE